MRLGVFIVMLAFCAIFFNSCYERMEGCTDINAANFNPAADDPCCCNYPSLILQLQHRFGSDSIRFLADSTYFLEAGFPLKVLSMEVLADRFELTREDGTTVRVEDRIDFTNGKGGDCPCVDDVFAFNLSSLNTGPGTIAQPGHYSGFKFHAGLSEMWSGLEPGDFPPSHPLAQTVRYDSTGQEYYQFRASIVFPATDDTLVLRSADFNQLLLLEKPIELARGSNTTLRLAIDYKRWFRGFEGVTEAEAAIELLRENMPESFSLSD